MNILYIATESGFSLSSWRIAAVARSWGVAAFSSKSCLFIVIWVYWICFYEFNKIFYLFFDAADFRIDQQSVALLLRLSAKVVDHDLAFVLDALQCPSYGYLFVRLS